WRSNVSSWKPTPTEPPGVTQSIDWSKFSRQEPVPCFDAKYGSYSVSMVMYNCVIAEPRAWTPHPEALETGAESSSARRFQKSDTSRSRVGAPRKRATPPDRPSVRRRRKNQRFENWKLFRALARPYFLRSTTRLSRVRKPAALTIGRSAGSNFDSAWLMPCLTAPAWPESPPPFTVAITSYWPSRPATWNG